jgi:hypothetical protein
MAIKHGTYCSLYSIITTSFAYWTRDRVRILPNVDVEPLQVYAASSKAKSHNYQPAIYVRSCNQYSKKWSAVLPISRHCHRVQDEDVLTYMIATWWGTN